MAISFDKAFGVHQQTIGVRARRAEVLSGNIANADTPGYKARDLDFAQALKQAQNNRDFNLARTHDRHFAVKVEAPGSIKYRVPLQPDTGDGNTVDVQHERNAFLQNSMEYQASLEFLNGKISGLLKAIKGGQS